MITHIPVRIENDTFILTTERSRAYAVARAHSADEIELLWVVPSEPTTDARAVLETAGYSTTEPHGRISNG
jgi:hypothetical protein